MPSVGKVELVAGGAAAAVTAVLGGWSDAIVLLLVLLVVDFILGTIRAATQHKLSSWESARKTATKLGLIFCLTIVAVRMDVYFATEWAIRDAVVMFFAAAQGTSVVENAVPIAASVGWEVPPILSEMLAQLGSKGKKGT